MIRLVIAAQGMTEMTFQPVFARLFIIVSASFAFLQSRTLYSTIGLFSLSIHPSYIISNFPVFIITKSENWYYNTGLLIKKTARLLKEHAPNRLLSKSL